jgi:hypothetical protein
VIEVDGATGTSALSGRNALLECRPIVAAIGTPWFDAPACRVPDFRVVTRRNDDESVN